MVLRATLRHLELRFHVFFPGFFPADRPLTLPPRWRFFTLGFLEEEVAFGETLICPPPLRLLPASGTFGFFWPRLSRLMRDGALSRQGEGEVKGSEAPMNLAL